METSNHWYFITVFIILTEQNEYFNKAYLRNYQINLSLKPENTNYIEYLPNKYIYLDTNLVFTILTKCNYNCFYKQNNVHPHHILLN